MPWKTSDPHGDQNTKPIGRHVDVYKVNDAGKREKGDNEKAKVSYDENKPLVRDITPPKP